MHIDQLVLAKSSIKRKTHFIRLRTSHSGLWSSVAREWYPWLVIGQSCHTADNGQMWQKNDAPCRRLCLTADFNQMWSRLCPSFKDFVMQRTSTKCGPNCAPHWRTLSRSGLWPNVARIVPLIGGLCHTADFNQMWPKLCPLLEDFVTQRTSTKCGPKYAPRWRTLSHCRLRPNVVRAYAPHWRTLSYSGLWPNVVQTCAPQWRTLFCYGVWPHMDRQCTHDWKRPVPNKWILIVNQRRTKTIISDYIAMWSIRYEVSMPTSLDKEMTDLVSITRQMTNDADFTRPSLIQHRTWWERKAFL